MIVAGEGSEKFEIQANANQNSLNFLTKTMETF